MDRDHFLHQNVLKLLDQLLVGLVDLGKLLDLEFKVVKFLQGLDLAFESLVFHDDQFILPQHVFVLLFEIVIF